MKPGHIPKIPDFPPFARCWVFDAYVRTEDIVDCEVLYWIDPPCDDPECVYCAPRPETPEDCPNAPCEGCKWLDIGSPNPDERYATDQRPWRPKVSAVWRMAKKDPITAKHYRLNFGRTRAYAESDRRSLGFLPHDGRPEIVFDSRAPGSAGMRAWLWWLRERERLGLDTGSVRDTLEAQYQELDPEWDFFGLLDPNDGDL